MCKKYFGLLLLILLCTGCNLVPPQYSENNEYFENEKFVVNYPQGWKVMTFSTPAGTYDMQGFQFEANGSNSNLIFQDTSFKRYNFAILMTDPLNNAEINLPNDLLELIAHESIRKDVQDLKNNNLQISSTSVISITFDGRMAKKGIIVTNRFIWNKIFTKNVKDFYILEYDLWDDFTESTKKKIESSVYSFHIKSR